MTAQAPQSWVSPPRWCHLHGSQARSSRCSFQPKSSSNSFSPPSSSAHLHMSRWSHGGYVKGDIRPKKTQRTPKSTSQTAAPLHGSSHICSRLSRVCRSNHEDALSKAQLGPLSGTSVVNPTRFELRLQHWRFMAFQISRRCRTGLNRTWGDLTPLLDKRRNPNRPSLLLQSRYCLAQPPVCLESSGKSTLCVKIQL